MNAAAYGGYTIPDLPIGSLSPSAVAIITYLYTMNGMSLTPEELITIAKEAENKYVGVSCGKLDQSCEVYCIKKHLLYMDLKDDSYELILQHPDMKPYKIAIFFSGLEGSLVGSVFNMRVDECRSAAYALKAYAGMEYGKFDESNLRDVPIDVYLQYKDKLPEAWRRGDIEEFGRLCFESDHCSIYNYETDSAKLKTLYELMTRTAGIYGGRFSGAGFKGCCMVLIDPAYEESIKETVTREYLKVFPHMEEKYSVHICESADGVHLN